MGDFGTPEQETGRFYGDRSTYWESNMTICHQWAWKPNDRLKSLKECIDLLVTNAGCDGNFMLNVGPMPDGQIEPRQVERLREIGRWMKQYGQQHLWDPGRSVPAGQVGRQHVPGRQDFRPRSAMAGRGTITLPPWRRRSSAAGS